MDKIGWHKKFICGENQIPFLNYHGRENEFIIVDNIEIEQIKNKVIEIFHENDFVKNYDINKCNIEFHYSNALNHSESTWSAVHKDEENGLNVNTLICYFDVDCIGGKFGIYDKNYRTIKEKINIKNKMLIFTGIHPHHTFLEDLEN